MWRLLRVGTSLLLFICVFIYYLYDALSTSLSTDVTADNPRKGPDAQPTEGGIYIGHTLG